MSDRMSDVSETLLANYSPEVQAICKALRAVAQTAMPEAHEIIYHASLNYSLSESVMERLCYIAPQKTYANLGFFFGAELPDPHHLLTGEGKRLRHVKVRTLHEAQSPALVHLVRAAWEAGPTALAQLKQNMKRE